MKNKLTTLLIVFATLTGCGQPPQTFPSTQHNTSNDYPPVEDDAITESENAVARTANNLENDPADPRFNDDGATSELAPVYTPPPTPTSQDNCRMAQGYKSGNPHAICVVTVQGKLLEVTTAAAFLQMATAAARDGIALVITNGFHTMNQQRHLHTMSTDAAYPGFSLHQTGTAIDIDPAANNWLMNNAATYGFFRTTQRNTTHWEWIMGRSLLGSNPSDCYSSTTNRYVQANTCVQSRGDTHWYTCIGGPSWTEGMMQCSSTFPLTIPQQPSRTECFSITLDREVPLSTCVRNGYDHQPYVCTTVGWVPAVLVNATCSD
jgi:predicted small lipoprotein YifL